MLDAGALVALAVMLWWWSSVGQSSHWLYEGGFALHALLTATVIAAACINGLVARLLAFRPLAALGLISYGVYLYHWPIFLWLSPERTGLSTAPLLVLRVACTLAVATASLVLLERPIRTGTALPRILPRVALPATASGARHRAGGGHLGDSRTRVRRRTTRTRPLCCLRAGTSR